LVNAITLLRLGSDYNHEIICKFPENSVEFTQQESISGEITQGSEGNLVSKRQLSPCVTALNYAFNIPSRWSPTEQEQLVVSLLFNESEEPSSPDAIELKFQSFADKIASVGDVFKAFYRRKIYTFPKEERPHIREKREMVEQLVREFFLDAQDKGKDQIS
jgi:hypothetical protein